MSTLPNASYDRRTYCPVPTPVWVEGTRSLKIDLSTGDVSPFGSRPFTSLRKVRVHRRPCLQDPTRTIDSLSCFWLHLLVLLVAPRS